MQQKADPKADRHPDRHTHQHHDQKSQQGIHSSCTCPPGVPRPAGWWSAPIPGKELMANGVYRLTPDGTLSLVVDDFALPNGLAFAPDESVLYIDDSAHKHLRAFDVRPDGTLTNSRILVDMASDDPGVPDGLKVDQRGHVFCTGPGARMGACSSSPPELVSTDCPP
jgi:SMP-30/gluconolaconase/LRE-like protein